MIAMQPLTLFPMPVDVSLPSRCDGLLPNGRRCMVRGRHSVAGGLYCRHHVPSRAIRFDAVQGAKDGAGFAGAAYDKVKDFVALTGQICEIYALMADGQYRTLAEIERATGHPQASISAQLRNLCKPEWGGHTKDKRRRVYDDGKEARVWEYRLIPNPRVQLTLETKEATQC